MGSKIQYSKMHPLPAYTGPQPVYRATFPWVGAVDCLVRRNGNVWETAEYVVYLHLAKFSACPVAGAGSTRHCAVMAFDYYFNKK